jgi:hypothetical protein
MDAVLRDRVGLLCDQLSRWPSLYTTIHDAGVDTELAELLTVLAETGDPDQARIQALLDAIDEACKHIGLAALTTRSMGLDPGGLTLPAGLDLPSGLDGTAGAVVGWTCPLRRCDRVVTAGETAQQPTCAARQNSPMTPYTLPPQ